MPDTALPPLKVFQVSDDEWFYGETLAAALAAYEELTGTRPPEAAQEFDIHELTEAQLAAPDQVDLSEDRAVKKLVSFRQALDFVMSTDGKRAGMLCGCE